MTTGETILFLVLLLLALLLLVGAYRAFRQRGFLFNNAYLYASERERETMDKAPYYRQTAVVFLLLASVFIVIALSLALHSHRILLAEIPLLAGAVIYAIVSTVRIKRTGK